MELLNDEYCPECGTYGEHSKYDCEKKVEKLQDEFNRLKEFKGIPIIKDNYENLFDRWLEEKLNK